MPRHILIKGQAAGLEGCFALDTCSPICIPTPPVMKLIEKDRVEGKPGIPAEIRIEGHPFDIKFNSDPKMQLIGSQLQTLYPDVPMLGVLGQTFLRQHTTRIDYLAQTVSLYELGALPLPAEGELGPEHTLVDVTYSEQKHILVEAAMGEKEELTGKLGFDLGATTYEFPPELGKQHGFPAGKIPQLRIGSLVWKDIQTKYYRDVAKGNSKLGVLGNEQLFNTVVTIYPKEMKLEIRRDPSRRPGVPPREIGLTLEADATVTAVKAGSRAETLGLKAGDRLLIVDGRPVSGRMETQSAFRFHDGTSPLALTVAREGQEISIKEVP